MSFDIMRRTDTAAFESAPSLESAEHHIHVRLAQTDAEIQQAQELRYRVFYEEGKAFGASNSSITQRRDFDRFDPFCQHLIAIDKNDSDIVVGSYRLLSREAAQKSGGFFSSSEYDLSLLEKADGKLLELGRACVDKRYRGKGLVQALWRAIANYVKDENIRFLFGVANFPTTSVEDIKHALSYLHHYFLAEESVRPKALPEGYISLNQMNKEDIDPVLAQEQLPPFIKGYTRIGGWVGEGAFLDRQFGSTDVCIVLEMHRLTERYSKLLERNEL